LDVVKVRSALLNEAHKITQIYEELIGLYRGWFSDSVIAGPELYHVKWFETRMASHLESKRDAIRTAAVTAVRVAAVSLHTLAGDVFRTQTTQSASLELQALVAQQIEQCLMTQLRKDQKTLTIRRQRERLRQLSDVSGQSGFSSGVNDMLYRSDSLGRRRQSILYVHVETQHSVFSLVNTLTHTLMLARGDTVCALAHALEKPETISMSDFADIQRQRMHPRSTLLIHRILDS
jgi:hypothetical protein